MSGQRTMRSKVVWLWLVLAGMLISFVQAQDAGPTPGPAAPKVTVAAPLAAVAGRTTKLTLFGQNLDKVSAVRLPQLGEAASAKVVSAGAEVVVELTLPQSAKSGDTDLVVEGPGGMSEPYRLWIDGADTTVDEQEPNDGFAQTQTIELGKTVNGTIHAAKNVDVFRFGGEQGQEIAVEVVASARGSAADLMLMLFTASGQLLGSVDDEGNDRDPVLKAKLPESGDYLVVVMESQDAGGWKANGEGWPSFGTLSVPIAGWEVNGPRALAKPVAPRKGHLVPRETFC